MVYPNDLNFETPHGLEEGVKNTEKKEESHLGDLESGRKMFKTPPHINKRKQNLEEINSLKEENDYSFTSKICKSLDGSKYLQNANKIGSPKSMKNIYNEKIYPINFDLNNKHARSMKNIYNEKNYPPHGYSDIQKNEKIFPMDLNNSNSSRKNHNEVNIGTPISNSSSELGHFVRVSYRKNYKHNKNSNSVNLINIEKNQKLFEIRNETFNKSALYYDDFTNDKKKEINAEKKKKEYKKLNTLC